MPAIGQTATAKRPSDASGQRRRDILAATLAVMIALAAQLAVWQAYRPQQAEWANVPPAPSARGAAMSMLGDRQMAYRAIGIMLQNLGDEGGRSTRFENYDYHRLGRWFMVQDQLDSRSDYTPLLAAFYYGATENQDDLTAVVDYLLHVGDHSYPRKWRWMAQGIYLARFKQGDLDKALSWSYRLAAKHRTGMPAWVLQMPAFILAQKGDQEAAYDLAIGLLRDEAENMHPAEVNFMRGYICERILNAAQAAINPLCVDAP